MTIKVTADLHKCEGIGMCETQADDFFRVGDDGFVELLSSEVPDGERSYVRAAVESCPVSALRLVES
ncbi:MAG: ferredoxin [Nocardioides sp.]|uniref:ferredoxin n=1 Tax=Nocardioides sp. TaxID=35761 RepID=UPI0039E373BB